MTLFESAFAGGPWPVVVLVQVTLVALLGVLAWLAARRGGSALRGAVLLGTLVGLLVVPGLAAVTPVWLPVGEFAWLEATGPEPVGPGAAAPPPPPPPVEAVPIARTARAAPLAEPSGKLPPGLADPGEELDEFPRPPDDAEPDEALVLPSEDAAPPVRPVEPPRRPPSPAGVLAAVWLLGALACLARALVRLALLYNWAWRARRVRGRQWTARLKSLAERFGLPAVDLRESPAIASPLTLGLFRPVILLPTCRRTWSAEQQDLVLAHELAHVRRRDFLAGLVAELAACLCWFHPLVRWLAGRLRLEQEYTADAWAASAASDTMNYVRCLARLALELGGERGSLAPAFWRRRPEILRRIDMLRRNPHGHSPRLAKGTAWTVAVLAATACVAVAGVGPLRSAAEDPPPAQAAPEVKAPATADLHGDPLPAGALARLGTTRLRHGAPITFVAFGPEGKTLITAGQDNTARLWDLATGKEIRRFARPKAAEINPRPALPPATKAQLEALKVKLDAEQAQLQAVIRQRAKLVEAKPPVKLPGAAADEKEKTDAEKAAAEKARLEAEKAKLAAEQAKLADALARQAALARGDAGGFGVAVTPDGKTLAVAGGNVVQLYEVETGKELVKIQGPPTGLAGLLFSPDGRTLAGRGGDGAVHLWEAANGKETHRINRGSQPDNLQVLVARLRGSGGDSPGIAFSPDGKALAVATTEVKEQKNVTSWVGIWDAAAGKETGKIEVPEGLGPVSAVAFASGGKALAYGTANVIILCEPDTGKELRQIKAPGGVASLDFSPDGKSLAVRGRNQQFRLLETETGKEQYQLGEVAPAQTGGGGGAVVVARPVLFTPETRNLAFSPDGKQIVTASGGTARLWDAATGKEMSQGDGHQGALAAVALSADGKSVVSWGADAMIRRWEAATGKPLGSFRVPIGTTLASFSPDGRTVALANADNSIRLLETATGKVTHLLAGPANGTGALAFAPDGKVLAARGGDNNIRLYDVDRGNELRQMVAQAANDPAAGGAVAVKLALAGGLAGGSRAGLVFSPDGKLLASPGSSSVAGVRAAAGARGAAGANRGTIDLYDVTTGKLLRKIESSQPAVSFAFSPDGRVLATENADQSITLWEVASGKDRAHLGKAPPSPPAMPGAVAFAVAGRRLAVAEPAGPTTLAFSPDGRALVARGPDLSAHVWDVTGGKEVGQFKGHEGRIETLAFAPDGKSITSGSADTTVLLWDAATLMKDFPKPQLAELPDVAVDSLWGDLADEDAAKALQGVLKLTGAPGQAVPYLAERLKPAAAVESQKVEGWIADLESDRFAVRQEASASLLKAGDQVVPALRKVLESQPTIETRKRAEELLDKLTGGTLTTEQLRLVRAVEALERMGTPEARQVLRTLAQGAPGALPTREAQAALDRLSR
jgi:WD40 repeat protein/beta-lactamase regulating signal transducer with metallopeptidase domain